MRWACPKFALFAVIAVLMAAAISVFGAVPSAHSQSKESSATRLLWTDTSEEPKPSSRPDFFVRVSGDQDTRPTGSVTVRFDAADPKTHSLVTDDADADGKLAKKTGVFSEFLTDAPHRIETSYAGDAAVNASADLLHIPKGQLTATYDEPYVVWTFTLMLREGTSSGEIAAARQDKPVAFAIDDKPPQAVPLSGEPPRATLRTLEPPGNHRAIATYSGDLNFQPVQRDAFIHVQESSVSSVPASSSPPRPTTTTRPSTRRVATPTTAALAPINPGGTSTTIAGQTSTTFESFGDFTTIPPPTTGQLSAAANNDDDGPPVAVVATTLLALAALGGVAAFRRYRKGGIDWF